MRSSAFVAAALLVACSPDPPPRGPGEPSGSGQPDGADGSDGEDGADGSDGGDDPAWSDEALDRMALLARLSLDLRATRPTLAELAAVGDDPAALDPLVDDFLADRRWTGRVMEHWNDAVHTRAWAASYTRFGELSPAQQRALGEAPLRTVAAVAWEDRPFTDVVTGEQVQMNGALAALWGAEAPGGLDEDGWGWASFPDARPTAGVLSGTTLWLRYSPDELSKNRVRANALARVFLCSDFLEREGAFQFSVDPTALTSVEDAVATQGECLACHASLDPLAAVFGGFTWRSEELPLADYVAWSQHAADAAAAQDRPGYYGAPARDLADVGALVAQDPRFARCAVERFYTGLVGAPPGGAALQDLTVGFVADGHVVRPLVHEIVSLDAYRDPAPRVATPGQLSVAFADLLGVEPPDPDRALDQGLGALLWSDQHRVLGGGTDDQTVLQRNRTAGLGLQVLTMWAAREALPLALEVDRARPVDERRLLRTEAGATEAEVRAALAEQHARFLSRPVSRDAAVIDGLHAVWQAGGGDDDPRQAWAGVAEALLRHPLMVLY